jgi:GH15 family glucan-1,4-alpha-glucosidase
MPYEPIENYGIIGNLETVALVGRNGSVDFCCAPFFDSPSVFAALLDDARGGRFCIAPLLDGATTKQLYLPDTNVLLTRFLADDGVVEISDFMPIHEDGAPTVIVRRVETVRGEVRFRMQCMPRPDYARARVTIERAARSSALQRNITSRSACTLRCRCRSRKQRSFPSSRCAPTSRRRSSSRKCFRGGSCAAEVRTTSPTLSSAR